MADFEDFLFPEGKQIPKIKDVVVNAVSQQHSSVITFCEHSLPYNVRMHASILQSSNRLHLCIPVGHLTQW